MKNSDSNIEKLFNIKILGSGTQPVLFAHGYGCDQNMWRFVYPHFEENYKIILFDYIGAGKSDLSAYSKTKYDSLQGYADDIIKICAHLNLKDAIFVGHSVSSMIGVLAINKEPSLFSKMVLIGPSPRYINDKDYKGGFEESDIQELLHTLDSNYLGWSKAMAPVIMGNEDRPELGEELSNSFCTTDPEIAKNFARVTFLSDNRKDLKLLDVPCLILQCRKDIIAPLEVGQYTAKSIKNSSLKILEATGHCPNLSAPQETSEAIKEFLQT
ncbi:alpha/beta fold hydrolase [Ulvibacter antarcticus]|uniref:Sigma-B regulation protein RsbQ n=1 Tax=Ulvibacter antarcticus TaxID=442714 RepID=A0A3L9YLH3_9FLAO|nr:alpha/beta hydrolase [Ulvibacter antarcticus]RMA58995.1 sigma-B regulation protein RsbQ [Ulvibacter antarcticus]